MGQAAPSRSASRAQAVCQRRDLATACFPSGTRTGLMACRFGGIRSARRGDMAVIKCGARLAIDRVAGRGHPLRPAAPFLSPRTDFIRK